MTARKKVILLNPPGSQNYIRDYYCSKVSKAGYVSCPIVLLFLSGILAETCEVRVIDAIALRLGPKECRRLITEAHADALIFLTGAVSWQEDFAFLAQLKKETGIRLIGQGDIFLEGPQTWLDRHSFLDAVLLNFATDDILTYLAGPSGVIPNIVYRQGDSIVQGPYQLPANEFTIPVPRHELFPLARYRFPFSLRHPMAVLMTDYGCPFQCSFCVIHQLGFRLRALDNVREELRYLSGRRIRELFFIDQTFGAVAERSRQLCALMKQEQFGFSWSCFSRVDVLDEPLLQQMRECGCHTIIFGVESGSQRILDLYRKRVSKDKIRQVFATCRRLKIRTAATFILGLPEETEEDCLATIAFAKELGCDFAAFNVAIPRMGTQLRAQALADKLIPPDLTTMDQSGTYAVMDTVGLSRERVVALSRQAMREFYLRPGYLLRRMRGLRSWWDMQRQLAEGAALFGKLWK